MRPSRLLCLSMLAGIALLCGCRPTGLPTQPAQTVARSTRPRSDSANVSERHRPEATDDQRPFDYYLLNLSWSPEFCFHHRDAPECQQHLGFILHGLWPQRFDGTYPEHCSAVAGPENAAAYADIYPDPHLLLHEWQTHGTCSGLSPSAFFTQARSALQHLRVPQQLLSADRQIAMPPSDVLALFVASNPGLRSDSLALSCGNNFLTAVEECLDRSLHPIACGRIRSCRANSVRIPPVR